MAPRYSLPFEFDPRWDELTRKFQTPDRVELAALLEERDRRLEDFLANLRLSLPAQGVGVKRTSAQSIPNATDTAVSFTSSDYDDSGTWWDAGSPTLVTAPEPGRYMAQGFFSWDPNTTGQRKIQVQTTGSGQAAIEVNANSAGYQAQSIVALLDLEAGDTVKLIGYQNSGGSLNLGTFNARLSVSRLGSTEDFT